jgi:hypothetical protein
LRRCEWDTDLRRGDELGSGRAVIAVLTSARRVRRHPFELHPVFFRLGMSGTPLRRFIRTRSIRATALAGEIRRACGRAHRPEAEDHQTADKTPFRIERRRPRRADAPAAAGLHPGRSADSRKAAITEGQGK